MKKISALAVAGVLVASLAGSAFAEGADVKVGGEVRLRDEWKTNFSDFNNDNGDQQNFIVQRTRVNVDAKIDEKTKAYVSLENNRNWGSGSNSTVPGAGNDTVSVYEAYVQLDKLFDQPLYFKAGRQKIALGSERLFGANDWNAGQTFDAAILGYNHELFNVALFHNTAVDRESVSSSPNGAFNGLYVTVKSIPMNTLDVYAIQKYDIAAAGESFITYGARLDGNAMNIDWNVEGALQSGDAANGTTKSANAAWIRAGYTIPQAAGLRIGAEYDHLSGSSATDTDNKSFDPLFPTKHSTSMTHSVYGITDIVENNAITAFSGLTAFSINASAMPVEGLKLLAEYWNFSTPESFATSTGTSDKVGSEFNVQAWYDLSKSTSIHAYYALFSPDKDFANTVRGDNSDKADGATDAVLQLCVKF